MPNVNWSYEASLEYRCQPGMQFEVEAENLFVGGTTTQHHQVGIQTKLRTLDTARACRVHFPDLQPNLRLDSAMEAQEKTPDLSL